MDKPLLVGKVVDPVVAEREESGGGSSSGSGHDDDDDDEDGRGSGGKGGMEILLAKANNNTLRIPEVTLISQRHLHNVTHLISLEVESLRGRLCDDETRAEIRRLSRRMEACGVGGAGRVAREGEALEGECREVVQRCREQEEGEEEERGTAADADAQPVIKGPEADKRKVLIA